MQDKKHYHHHHHHHFDASKVNPQHKPEGFIRHTISGIAETFNVSRKVVIIGFIVLFLFTHFFSVVVFLVASHWVRNQAKYDDFFGTAFEKSRHGFNTMRQRHAFSDQATADGPDASYQDDDFDFSDLNRKFDDLKRRTSGMEEHVSSEDYKLNKEFKNL